MKNIFWLQLFAEGEDAGASVETPATTEAPTGESPSQMDNMMSRIPERARGAFKEAYQETHKEVETPPPVEQETPPERVPLAELIKTNAEYKAEYQAGVEKAIANRFKKYDGIEQKNAQMQQALDIVAQKYGIDPTSSDFVETLTQKISADDSFYENYAMEHDMSVEEAKRNLALERKVRDLEAREQQQRQQEENRQAMQTLYANAEKTKLQFPSFDLDTEMQSEQFRRLVIATGGDTTAAFHAVHWNEIIPQRVAIETEKARQAITQSIASGQTRPSESGLSKVPAAVVNAEPSYNGMSAKQMREFAERTFRKR